MVYTDRIVILVDADCFYCQVEEKLDPSLQGKPIAVVQFNAWRDGGIIAVNYAARDKGCTKGMWMNEAKQKCPEIQFARVTNVRGRADLTKYRDASKKVADVLQTFTQNIERASIDESYIDVTDLVKARLEKGENSFQKLTVEQMPDTHIVGSETAHFLNNLEEYNEFTETNCRLAIGGLIAQEMRAAIFEQTGYKCSAGIAHNKILSKLACGFHKPNQQTILPADAVPELFTTLPLIKIKRLGGKFGASVSQALQVTNVGDLLKYSEKDLTKKFDEKTGKWLYNIARGIDLEPVTTRIISKSISCCKRFPFKHVLTALGSVEHWLNELAIEITDRLEQELTENNRRAKQITVSFAQEIDKKTVSGSRTFPITCYKQEKIFRDAFELVKKNLEIKSDGSLIVNFLGLTAGNFQENKKNNIVNLFKNFKDSRVVKKEEEPTEKHDKNLSKKGNVLTNKSKVYGSQNNNIASTSKENHETTNKCELKESEDESISFTVNKNDAYAEKVKNINIEISYDDWSYTSDEFNSSDEEIQENCQSQKWSDPVRNSSEIHDHIQDLHRETTCEEISNNTDDEHTKDDQLNVTVDHYPNESRNSSNSLKQQYTKSFFLNYFANLEKKNREDVTVFRNPLEEASTASTSPFQEYDPVNSEICLECRSEIPKNEMVSHMDYHFAVKLINEEKAINKTSTTDKKPIISPNSTTKKSNRSSINSKNGSKVKKKSVQSKPITSFLGKKEELNDWNSDVCGECKKRVRFEDFDNHSDYHAAKRLHIELNSQIKTSNLVTDKSAVKNGIRTSKDISNFFKKS